MMILAQEMPRVYIYTQLKLFIIVTFILLSLLLLLLFLLFWLWRGELELLQHKSSSYRSDDHKMAYLFRGSIFTWADLLPSSRAYTLCQSCTAPETSSYTYRPRSSGKPVSIPGVLPQSFSFLRHI